MDQVSNGTSENLSLMTRMTKLSLTSPLARTETVMTGKTHKLPYVSGLNLLNCAQIFYTLNVFQLSLTFLVHLFILHSMHFSTSI